MFVWTVDGLMTIAFLVIMFIGIPIAIVIGCIWEGLCELFNKLFRPEKAKEEKERFGRGW